MRAIQALLLGCIAVATAAAAPAPYERWDTKLKNAAGWTLKEEDIAWGGKPAMLNGDWQGNWNFELSNCPRAGCRTFEGRILRQNTDPIDYLGTWTFPDAPCVLEAKEGEDRWGNASGFVFKLRPTDAAKHGCAAVPASLAGKYVPNWINHAKMAAESAAAR